MTPAVTALFLTGLVSLIGQIVLMRELSVAFFGVELIYLIALGIWLLLTALGTIAGQQRNSASPARAATLLLAFALCLPLGVVFLRGSRLLLGGVLGAYLPFPRQMAALLIALAPAGLLSGLLFRAAAGLYAVKGRTLAGAYGIESAGALTGGILATLCLRWGIQNFPLAVACGLLSAVAALLILGGATSWRRRGIAIVLAILMAILLGDAAPLDRQMTAWNHPGLLATRDSAYGRISLTLRTGQLAVFTDDVLAFETEGAEAELLAHLAALQHRDPQRILILGGGLDGTVRELLRHRPLRIDWVELDRVMIAMTRRHLPEGLRASLEHPSVHLIMTDPRRFLRESGAAYDLILVGMPEPSSGQANRFYTREFFRQCASHLNPGGLIGLRLPAPENYWTPQWTRRTASIHRALASVFPELLALPGATTVITASRTPLPRSPEILIERLRTRAITTRLVSPPYIRYLFAGDRFADLEQRLRATAVPMNRDIRPVCYPYAVMIWLAKFFPKLATWELPGIGSERQGWGTGWWPLWLGLSLLFLASRAIPSWRRGMLVAVAGFLGIVSEAILILTYQAREGVLYQDIGLLLMMFMAGLSLGAWMLNEAIRWTGIRKGRSRWWGRGLIAGFCLLGILVNWFVGGDSPGGLLPTAALLAAAGFLVSGVLAYAALFSIRDQQKVIAPLYAADLLGGCLGSILGGLVLIPLFGLDGTALGMALLAALAVLLL